MDASSASCWIVKLDLPNLFKPLSRPLTRCCVATAVLLDGYRHTVGWLPPHFVVNRRQDSHHWAEREADQRAYHQPESQIQRRAQCGCLQPKLKMMMWPRCGHSVSTYHCNPNQRRSMEESKYLQSIYKIFRTFIYLSLVIEFFEYASSARAGWISSIPSVEARERILYANFLKVDQEVKNMIAEIQEFYNKWEWETCHSNNLNIDKIYNSYLRNLFK